MDSMLGEGTIFHPPPHSVRSTYPGFVADLKRRIDGARLSAANWWACTGTSGKPSVSSRDAAYGAKQ
jgi:hypothetical protein